MQADLILRQGTHVILEEMLCPGSYFKAGNDYVSGNEGPPNTANLSYDTSPHDTAHNEPRFRQFQYAGF